MLTCACPEQDAALEVFGDSLSYCSKLGKCCLPVRLQCELPPSQLWPVPQCVGWGVSLLEEQACWNQVRVDDGVKVA